LQISIRNAGSVVNETGAESKTVTDVCLEMLAIGKSRQMIVNRELRKGTEER
jgi:hypothetical protein